MAAPRQKTKTATSKKTDAEVRLRTILDTVVDGIVVIDERGLIELFNPAAEKLFGYTRDEVLGQPVAILIPEAISSRHQSYVEHYLATGEAKIIGVGREVQGQRKDGSIFPIELAVSETISNGKRTFTGLVHDITERKRLEQAIVDASEMERKQIGQDLHDTVSQHLAGLTMLTAVLQQKIGQEGETFQARLTPDANRIAELAATALRQVKDISHGLYPVELERNGLGASLQQLTAQQGALYGIPCVYECAAGDLTGMERSTAMHLYRIAQEAISNAIKHAQPNEISVTLWRDHAGLALSIRDDGKGMPKRRKNPAGLGLAIMHYRASMIGSELEILSKRGRGTTVRCVLNVS